MPDPTEAELDELEKIAQSPRWITAESVKQRLLSVIKALRACRRQSRAKFAVIEAAKRVNFFHVGLLPDKYAELDGTIRDLEDALTALDTGTHD